MVHRQGSTWSRYNPKGLQSVDKSKPEQGQGEEFIAMLNPVVWSKGTGVEIVKEIPLNCCNLGLELHVVGITTAGTT